ncbi:hypothetical protein D3C87_104330 [compost metagenome]
MILNDDAKGIIMKSILFLIVTFAVGLSSAALPVQYEQCLPERSKTLLPGELQEMAKLVRVIVCQNYANAFTADQTLDLLKSKNISMGISLAQTGFLYENLLAFAKVNPYVLFVDSNRLFPEQLEGLARAGVEIVVISGKTAFPMEGLRAFAKKESFTYHVNSNILKENLKDLASLKVKLVIEAVNSSISKEALAEIAQANADLITVLP